MSKDQKFKKSRASVSPASDTCHLISVPFIPDPMQAQALDRLEDLCQRLVEFKRQRQRWFGRSLLQPVVPRGLYLWGAVGRGKSVLMDAFYQSLPYQRKRRVHFHHFMAEVHRDMRCVSSQIDPLLAVAKRIAKHARLLCLDEFHVSDIADAMILARLLAGLIEQGVVLVMTSNYPPSGLYPDGLQRERFLPAIAHLERALDVFQIAQGQDYRLRALESAECFLTPDDGRAEEQLQKLFNTLADGAERPHTLTLFARHIALRRHAPGLIWFDFSALCESARAQTDYLAIACEYHTVFLSHIPQLMPEDASAARRFTWLIDVLYDHRVKFIASSAVAIDAIYCAGEHATEFARTCSRLTEMQSKHYLLQAHYQS